MNKNYIGENIRIYRERKDMTQKELAEKIGKTWEMISRYERGASSPFKQIDSLADALKVDSSDLLKKPSENKKYVLNRVPLFKSLPKNMDFINTKPYEYYIAPDWILDQDLESFVVDSKLLNIKDDRLKHGGYIFVAPNLKTDAEREDPVLKKVEGGLVIDKKFNSREEDIIGKVLAQEIRF
jgi:transcriptional regulator with XRE-family HTH domain